MSELNLINESCKNFSELLASKSPVPGGGGAAALVGALGAALCEMAGNFTSGKKKYADVENDIKINLKKTEFLRKKLLELVDEDARAFIPLGEAYKIPKDDPKRPEIFEAATLNACKAPIEIIKSCAEVIELLEEMSEKCSKLLISDVACGAFLCRAAMESAATNVYINTSSLNDRDKAKEIENEIDGILKKYCPRASDIAKKVNEFIRS